MGLDIFAASNVIAWCVVPYDARERDAVQRADMLSELGLRGEAWDWREQHTPHLGEEIDALTARDLELVGLWVPHVLPASGDTGLGEIDPTVRELVHTAARAGTQPQLWACLEFGDPGPVAPLSADDHRAAVERAARHVAPLAELAADHHLQVALYNHLGWAGEPRTMVDIVEALAGQGHSNVGIVYHQHHGHAHLDDFTEHFELIRPHLLALGLNGMDSDQHWGGRKIVPVGHGEHDMRLARIVAESGWEGPVSILSHTMDDAADRLRDNLEGLAWMVETLSEEHSGSLAGAPPERPTARISAPVWPH